MINMCGQLCSNKFWNMADDQYVVYINHATKEEIFCNLCLIPPKKAVLIIQERDRKGTLTHKYLTNLLLMTWPDRSSKCHNWQVKLKANHAHTRQWMHTSNCECLPAYTYKSIKYRAESYKVSQVNNFHPWKIQISLRFSHINVSVLWSQTKATNQTNMTPSNLNLKPQNVHQWLAPVKS